MIEQVDRHARAAKRRPRIALSAFPWTWPFGAAAGHRDARRPVPTNTTISTAAIHKRPANGEDVVLRGMRLWGEVLRGMRLWSDYAVGLVSVFREPTFGT